MSERNRLHLQVTNYDVTAGLIAFLPIPEGGTITKITSAIASTLTGDLTITLEIGGTLVTGSTTVVTASGSAAGDIDENECTAANVVAAGGSVEVIFDSTPSGGTLQDYVLGPFLIADISSASQSQKVPVPMKGQIVGIYNVQAGTTTGTAELTVRKNGTDMTGCVLSCPAATGAVIRTVEVSPNLITGDVDEGDELDIDTDGGSTNAVVGTVMVRIRR